VNRPGRYRVKQNMNGWGVSNYGVHTVPSTERHRLLYTKFVERRPADAAELLAEIGWCLFDAVEFLHPGEDHAKDELRHLKRIVAGPAPTSKHGQPLIDANGLLRAKYWQDGGSHSGMQAAIEAADICGLAFTTDIRLNDKVRPKHACLFACGHRHHQASQIEVYQQGSKVFVEIGRNHAQRIDFEASALAVSRPTLRVEVFPSHELSVFVSGSLKGHLRLRQAFRPVNGKFTVGCDLDGKNPATFTQGYFLIDSIDVLNICRRLRSFSWSKRVIDPPPFFINPRDLRRQISRIPSFFPLPG